MKKVIKFIRISLVLSAVNLLLVSAVSGQETGSKKHYGGVGYFMPGFSFTDFGGINGRLSAVGIPQVQNGAMFMGGGGHFIFNNFILGGEGGGLNIPSSSNTEYNVSAKTGYGFFNLGYVVFGNKSLLVYPLAGIGGGSSSILITGKKDIPQDIDELLSSPGRQTVLTHGGLLLNLSIGADWFFTGKKSENFTGGWLLGLKAGYVVDLSGDELYMDEYQIKGGGSMDISGFYIRLTIGGGGVGKK